MTRSITLPAAFVAAFALSGALMGCEKQVEAPMNAGVCWQMVEKDGKPAFNIVSEHEPSIEACAASLEGMRLHFLAIGGSAEIISGAYQGQFLFLQREGVFTSQTLKGGRYLLLVRTGDGQLAKLGAGPAAAP